MIEEKDGKTVARFVIGGCDLEDKDARGSAPLPPSRLKEAREFLVNNPCPSCPSRNKKLKSGIRITLYSGDGRKGREIK